MQKREVIDRRFVPANQHAPKAIHPPMHPFHHPPPRFAACLAFEGLHLFAPAADISGKAKLAYGLPHVLVVIALIQTQALRVLGGWRGMSHRKAVDRHPHQLHVLAIGPRDCQSNGDAGRLCQHATCDACLAAIGGVGAGVFPRPAGPWSVPHPCSASPSLSPSHHPTTPARPPRTARTRPRPPMLATADARWSPRRGPSYPGPSTGPPSATQRRCHWCIGGSDTRGLPPPQR
jgi:hypothetical protein